MSNFLNIIRLKNKHFDFVAKRIALVAKSISYLNVFNFFFLIYEVLNTYNEHCLFLNKNMLIIIQLSPKY